MELLQISEKELEWVLQRKINFYDNDRTEFGLIDSAKSGAKIAIREILAKGVPAFFHGIHPIIEIMPPFYFLSGELMRRKYGDFLYLGRTDNSNDDWFYNFNFNIPHESRFTT